MQPSAGRYCIIICSVWGTREVGGGGDHFRLLELLSRQIYEYLIIFHSKSFSVFLSSWDCHVLLIKVAFISNGKRLRLLNWLPCHSFIININGRSHFWGTNLNWNRHCSNIVILDVKCFLGFPECVLVCKHLQFIGIMTYMVYTACAVCKSHLWPFCVLVEEI